MVTVGNERGQWLAKRRWFRRGVAAAVATVVIGVVGYYRYGGEGSSNDTPRGPTSTAAIETRIAETPIAETPIAEAPTAEVAETPSTEEVNVQRPPTKETRSKAKRRRGTRKRVIHRGRFTIEHFTDYDEQTP